MDGEYYNLNWKQREVCVFHTESEKEFLPGIISIVLDYNACITDEFRMLVLMVFNLCKITSCYKFLQLIDKIMIRDDIGDTYRLYVEFCSILSAYFVHLLVQVTESSFWKPWQLLFSELYGVYIMWYC